MTETKTETKREYEIGYGKPPEGRRFKKGQSGNPSGARAKKPTAPILVRKFDEQVVEASNARCQKTTRREVVIIQLTDQPVDAGLSATAILTDLLQDIEKNAGPSARLAKVG